MIYIIYIIIYLIISILSYILSYIFHRFFNFDNWRSEVVSGVISGIADQDVSMDACASFGYSRLKPSEASFWAFFERR